MQTGRWKVFSTCQSWVEGGGSGCIIALMAGSVKERDDLLSASRYALMMKRFAVQRMTKETKFIRRKIT